MLNLRRKRSPIEVTAYMPLGLKDLNIVAPFMKPSKHSGPEVASCYGLRELQKRSLTIKAWQHIDIKQSDGTVTFDPTSKKFFGSEQHRSHLMGVQVIKVIPPITLTCDEDLDWVSCPTPFANHPLNIISGIVNFKYDHQPNFFIYFDTERELEYAIEPLTPLFHLVPLSDRPVKVKYVYDWDEGLKIREKFRIWPKYNLYKKMKAIRG